MMNLKPVSGYSGAQYPRMEDYLAKSEKRKMAPTVKLAIMLGMLALLMSSCCCGGGA